MVKDPTFALYNFGTLPLATLSGVRCPDSGRQTMRSHIEASTLGLVSWGLDGWSKTNRLEIIWVCLRQQVLVFKLINS